MQSPTAEVKEIVINLLKGKPEVGFSIAEIKNEVKEKAINEITAGVLAGAIHALNKEKQSGLVNIGRGIYAYNPKSIEKEISVTDTLRYGVDEAIKKLQNALKNIDVLDIDEKDLSNLVIVKKLIRHMEDSSEELLATCGDTLSKD